MSLSWRDTHRIALRPDGVVLAAMGRFKRNAVPRIWSCEPQSGEAAWQASLSTLASEVALSRRRSEVTVILSNHFCHFALLERPRALSTDAEALAYAKQRLQTLFGNAAGECDVELSPSGKDAWLACCVPSALLRELRDVFTAKRAAVMSIQPYFAAAWNRRGHRVRGKSGWFVVHESRRLVVGLVAKGRWVHLAARRTGDSLDQVLDVLDRERELLAEHGMERTVWLYGSAIRDIPAEYRGYTLNIVAPPRADRVAIEERPLYAMAA